MYRLHYAAFLPVRFRLTHLVNGTSYTSFACCLDTLEKHGSVIVGLGKGLRLRQYHSNDINV